MLFRIIESGFPDLPDAACKDIAEPERFFSFEGYQIEQARDVCRRCPAIRDCLTWALTHSEHGVWAATTADERADLIERHRRTA
jgi:WhiB family redox-sensing transcriptional regulator